MTGTPPGTPPEPGYALFARSSEAIRPSADICWAVAQKAERARWAAAEAELATCRERNAAIAAQSDQYRDQRDEAIAGYIDTADRDEYQLVIREMIAHWQYAGTTREDDELIAGWAQRAGLETQA